jgi:DNA-binding MarR family transcriptional regulator
MALDEPTSGVGQSPDSVVATVIDRVREDFPSVSELAVESHLTFLRATAVYSETLDLLYDQLGLSRSRFNLLWILYRTEGRRLSIGGLADNIGITAPSVMKMVQTLEAENWVTTVKGTTDRRVTFVDLTPTGRARFADFLRQGIRLWEDIWSEVADNDQVQLVKTLATLRRSLLRRYLGGDGLAAFRARQHEPTAGNRP